MGAYLSSPITEKESIDEQCSEYVYGASSMQGWRITQEDAHNCIPDFDPKSKTSFFAVYDGHGGAEVAKYCERHFPDFFKDLMESHQKSEDSEKIIKSAFLAFDATLTQDEVIKELKELSGRDDNDEEEEEDDPVGRTEADRLKEEANMPLDELLAQYGKGKPEEAEGSSSKDFPSSAIVQNNIQKVGSFQSPALRSKGASKIAANSSSQSNGTEPSLSSQPQNTSSSVTTSSSSLTSSASFSSAQETQSSNPLPNGLEDKNLNKTCSSVTNNCDVVAEDKENRTSANGAKTNDLSSESSNPSASPSKADSSYRSAEMSSSGCSSSIDAGGSGSSSNAVSQEDDSVPGSSLQERSSKLKAAEINAAEIALDGTMDSSDSDDEEADQEEMWEDMSDDEDEDDEEDDDEENKDENVPMMDMTNEEPGSDSGCTACVVLMQDKQVIVANAGDSRCVLSRAGKAVELSYDHKPEDDPERDRIEKAGGKVTTDGRVNGGLNLSRAIGDHVYKKNKELPAKDQMITALPDIEKAELTDDDQFLVIACDGIWNYMTSQEVVDYVLEKLKDPEKRKKPSIICEELFDHCLAPNTYGDGTGCDNMTCIIVVLNSYEPEENNNPAETTEVPIHKESILEGFKMQDSSEDSSSQFPDPDTSQSGPGSLKRCSDDVDASKEKRLKLEEEVA